MRRLHQAVLLAKHFFLGILICDFLPLRVYWFSIRAADAIRSGRRMPTLSPSDAAQLEKQVVQDGTADSTNRFWWHVLQDMRSPRWVKENDPDSLP